jgi:predicted RNase H-like nuclease (RuvC/YqgF family)
MLTEDEIGQLQLSAEEFIRDHPDYKDVPHETAAEYAEDVIAVLSDLREARKTADKWERHAKDLETTAGTLYTQKSNVEDERDEARKNVESQHSGRLHWKVRGEKAEKVIRMIEECTINVNMDDPDYELAEIRAVNAYVKIEKIIKKWEDK